MSPIPDHAEAGSLAGQVAERLREMLIFGDLAPGEKLSEHRFAARLGVSRNTLREAFRLLTREGLLVHAPNRGVHVQSPDEQAILDIYRVRRVIQRGAIEAAVPGHPALARMAACVAEAETARAAGDWRRVGSANMAFHRALVELCDSPRLNLCFANVLAELRLTFGLLDDAAYLHEPFVGLNARLLALIAGGDLAAAARDMDAYLLHSERTILGAFARRGR